MPHRRLVVLITDPTATKIITFTHPPRFIRSVHVAEVHYPYTLPAAGESGEMSVSLEIAGSSGGRTTPHSLIKADGSIQSFTAGCNFTNAFAVGVFSRLWETPEAVLLNPLMANMPQLSINLRYTPVDGTVRTYVPVTASTAITAVLVLDADEW